MPELADDEDERDIAEDKSIDAAGEIFEFAEQGELV